MVRYLYTLLGVAFIFGTIIRTYIPPFPREEEFMTNIYTG